MSKKKGSGAAGLEPDNALANIDSDTALSNVLSGKSAPDKTALMTPGGVAIIRRGDEHIPLDAQAIVTAGSKDHASQSAEAEARRVTSGQIISTREVLKAEVQGQVDQLNASLRAKDAEIDRVNVEFGKLRDENTRLLGVIADLKAGKVSGAGVQAMPVKKKKKKKLNIEPS